MFCFLRWFALLTVCSQVFNNYWGLSDQSGNVRTWIGKATNGQNLILDLKPIQHIEGVNLHQCLILCGQHGCKSFNYGEGECSLLESYYCKKTATSELVPKKDYTYYHVTEGKEKNPCDPITDTTATEATAIEPTTKEETTMGQTSIEEITTLERTTIEPTIAEETTLKPTTSAEEATTTACVTDGANGYNSPKGTPCVFPFVFKTVKYDGCITLSNSYTTSPWCSTDTQSQDYNDNKWGTCDVTVCPKDPGCATDGAVGPSPAGTPCVFPFNKDGIEYVQCTNVGYENDTRGFTWCSTNTDSESYDENKWGSCGSKCLVKECVTNNGNKCVYPFPYYENEKWRACTNAGKYKYVENIWCSYHPENQYAKGYWDYCIPECPREWASY